MTEKIKSLLGNEEFIAKLENMQDDEQTLALFKEYGVEVTADDLKSMMVNCSSDQLDENALDAVSGGGIAGYIVGKVIASWLRGNFSSGGGKGGGGGGGRRF